MLLCCVTVATANGDVWGPKPKPKKGKKRYKIPTYSSSTIEDRLADLGYDFDLQYNKHVKKVY